MYFFLPI
jgi:hypothetical protein